MDVEKVQKINALALELVKQGLVSDKEEAVREAERLLMKKDYSFLREKMGGAGEPAAEVESPGGEELGKEKIREILETNTSFMVKKMKEYQEQAERFKGEIGGLKSELAELRRRIEGLKFREAAAREEGGEEPRKSAPARESKSAVHPRSGNYKEEDVSIEKFFYTGNK